MYIINNIIFLDKCILFNLLFYRVYFILYLYYSSLLPIIKTLWEIIKITIIAKNKIGNELPITLVVQS